MYWMSQKFVVCEMLNWFMLGTETPNSSTQAASIKIGNIDSIDLRNKSYWYLSALIFIWFIYNQICINWIEWYLTFIKEKGFFVDILVT